MRAQTGNLLDLMGNATIEALGISLFVFLMMVVVDYVNVFTEGRLTRSMKGGKFRQYLTAGILGSTPGCLGSFLAVTMYIRGMLGFGALSACMIASSGDAAFVMLSRIPVPALILFGILLVLGTLSGWIGDLLAKKVGFEPCMTCEEQDHHLEVNQCKSWPENGVFDVWKKPILLRFAFLFLVIISLLSVFFGVLGPDHWNWIRVAIVVLLLFGMFVVFTVPDEYLIEHIWEHVAKEHLLKIFAWTLVTLVSLTLVEHFVDLQAALTGRMAWMVLAAGLVGILPDSGPHLFFVFLFADGTIPFSVLLTSSIVQDGHGMLPLLSVSVKDSLMVKAFNLLLGLAVGYFTYAMGY